MLISINFAGNRLVLVHKQKLIAQYEHMLMGCTLVISFDSSLTKCQFTTNNYNCVELTVVNAISVQNLYTRN